MGDTFIIVWLDCFFLVAGMCLRGFPFLVGFYSKDTIIVSTESLSGYLIFIIFVVGCRITVIYRLRMVYSGFMLP